MTFEEIQLTNEVRKRDSAATATHILETARIVFTEKGFDAVGTREIAERAGVSAALISRYFGSKEGLFAAAIPPTLNLDELLVDDMATFGARAAVVFLGAKEKYGYDPMIAMLRASTSVELAALMKTSIERQVVEALMARLEGPNKRERVGLICAQLLGMDVVGRLIGIEVRTEPDSSDMEQILAKSIQNLVDG